MQIFETPPDLSAAHKAWAGPVALVPTMGALHEGHVALLQLARETVGERGTVAVSIFVNPKQFNNANDLASYPQTLESDLEKCRTNGVDAVFAPGKNQFYDDDHSITIEEGKLSAQLCGATRPGHFGGVCTVVAKLFGLFQPDYAVFGKKDYQQLKIIERLVRDLCLPVKIVAAETHREADGLARSSRNVRLTPEHRADAPRLRKALLAARSIGITGERNPQQYLASAKAQLAGAPADFRLDYLQLVSRQNLQPLARMDRPALLAVAAFYGEVRLIDNIEINPA